MKLAPFNYSTENSGVLSSFTMGISQKGLPQLYEHLRRNTYSRPIFAAVKEPFANGTDAHVAAGIPNVPLEVTLPSFESPQYIVRDFGLGMSHERVGEVANYGESDKQESNDQIGGFGIGFKAPMAYADSFVIISRHKGIKNIYNAIINKLGIGEILHLNSEPTEEDSGVEIIIPVNAKDIDAFVNEALNLFSYSIIKPIINNCFKSFPDKKFITKTEKYGKLESKVTSVVVMGGMPYALDTKQLVDLTSGQQQTFKEGWEFYLPIGSLDVSGNREAIRFSENTVKTITDLILETIEDYRKQLQVDFDKCPNLKEAKKLWKKTKDENLFYRYCNSRVDFRGQEINNEYFDVALDDNFTVNIKNYSYKIKNSLSSDLKISALTNDIYYQSGPLPYFWRRINCLPKGAVVITLNDPKKPADFEEFKKKNYLEDFNFINLNFIVPPKTEREYDSSGRWVDPKHKKQVFELNKNITFNNNKNSWDITTIDANKGGIYVTLERFEVPNSQVIMDFLSLGLDNKVYGIKESLVVKGLDKKWISLSDFIGSYLKKLIAKTSPKTLQKVKDYEYYSRYLPDFSSLGVYASELPKGRLKKCYDRKEQLGKIKSLNKYRLAISNKISPPIEPSPRAIADVEKIKSCDNLIQSVARNYYLDYEAKRDCILTIAKYN